MNLWHHRCSNDDGFPDKTKQHLYWKAWGHPWTQAFSRSPAYVASKGKYAHSSWHSGQWKSSTGSCPSHNRQVFHIRRTFGTYWLQFIIAEVPKSWLISYTRHFDTNNDKRHQARTTIDAEVNYREYTCLVENGGASKLLLRCLEQYTDTELRTYITQMCPWIRAKLFECNTLGVWLPLNCMSFHKHVHYPCHHAIIIETFHCNIG